MPRTVSVAELGHGGTSRVVRGAGNGPVLVSKSNRPTAWIVSAEKLARIAAARGVQPDVYERALELLAVDLYRDRVLTLAQTAELSGMALGDFIDLCGRLQVPILWGTVESVEADVVAWLTPSDGSQPDA